MQDLGHQEFEELLKDEENQYCFDCTNSPAQWASVNNSIYLCLSCASVHRGFGVDVSYIRSIKIDSWNENQIKYMIIGGNRRLREILEDYGVSRSYSKELLYKSKLLDFHRRMLKSDFNNESNDKKPIAPSKSEALVSAKKVDDFSFSNSKSEKFSSVTNSGSVQNKNSDQTRYSGLSSGTNSNSNRFGSVGSDNSYQESGSGYLSTLNSWFGFAIEKSKEVAYVIKDKVEEYELGSKIIETGYKTVEVIKDTGYKVGQLEIVQTVTGKASEGLSFVSEKIWGPKSNTNSDYHSNSEGNGERLRSDYDNEFYVKLDQQDNSKKFGSFGSG